MTRLPKPLRPLFPVIKKGVLAATKLIGPVARLVPLGSRHNRPPRRAVADTPQHAAADPASGIIFVEVLPKIRISRSTPDGLPPAHHAFADQLELTIPPCIVARVPNGRAVGPYGAAIDAGGTLLFDLSPYFGAFEPSQHPLNLRFRLPAVHEVEGSLGVLTTRGSDNYYHFLLDVLPRLELMRRAGPMPGAYLVNRSAPFQRELLSRAGVSGERIVESSKRPNVRAGELVVASLPDSHLRTPPWVGSWLRGLLLQADPAAPFRRLYVTRGSGKNTRCVQNEEEILAALGPYGVVAVRPQTLTVAEQVRMFSEAELVIAPHGAGLTNIAFCPRGAAVIELFAPDYVNPCFRALADAVEGLRYRYLVGDGRDRRRRSTMGVTSDMKIGSDALVGMLKELGF